uniref:Protein BZZ1 n=1 Tax=Blastobotrys adeninivorans TaxID=409370 RepID=A0A060SZJ5_BLAAD
MDDIHSFYKERATIEKEYAKQLKALAAKYFEKKAKMSISLTAGDNPQVTPGSLENASLSTWTVILNETESLSKERQRLADEMSLQVGDQIHGLGLRFEELRKRYSAYNDKLIEDRDDYYSELKKSKNAYDSACQTMENQRSKASKSFDRSKDKANRKMEEKEVEMNNSKNSYLIKINVANRVKQKYYYEDVPELLDGLQELNEARVNILNRYWTQAVSIEKACLERCITNLDSMTQMVQRNNPTLDSGMFVRHNLVSWTEPPDFNYEPSPIWHDDEQMVTNDQELVFLRRKLHDASTKLTDQSNTVEKKIAALKDSVESKGKSTDKPSTYISELGRYLNSLQSFTTMDTKRLIYQVEVETIELAANGKDLSALPEPEKKKRGLFGLRRSKPASGGGAATSAAAPGASSSSGHGHGHGHGHGLFSSLVGRTKSHRKNSASLSQQRMCKVLYAYEAQGDDEVSISPGQQLVLVDGDDGSGWANVSVGGHEGLVPAAYIEEIAQPQDSSASIAGSIGSIGSGNSGKKKGPAVAPKKGAKKVTHMIALYDYDAQGDDELTIRAGDKIVVVKEDSGDGWTEGELNAMSGVFPTAYAKLA